MPSNWIAFWRNATSLPSLFTPGWSKKKESQDSSEYLNLHLSVTEFVFTNKKCYILGYELFWSLSFHDFSSFSYIFQNNINGFIFFAYPTTHAFMTTPYSLFHLLLFLISYIHCLTERTSRSFKEFNKRILVSTDLFGRGIDIERVNIVINYDFPDQVQ